MISLLVESNIPHNLMMMRGDPFNQELAGSEPVIKTLLIPRKPSYGQYLQILKDHTLVPCMVTVMLGSGYRDCGATPDTYEVWCLEF